MKSAGFEHWTFGFETEDVTSEILILDCISIIFIIYIMSEFLANFTYVSVAKWLITYPPADLYENMYRSWDSHLLHLQKMRAQS